MCTKPQFQKMFSPFVKVEEGYRVGANWFKSGYVENLYVNTTKFRIFENYYHCTIFKAIPVQKVKRNEDHREAM